MASHFLELKNISVEYDGVHALTDVSLSIIEGDVIALMGPNGAGKSTLLKTLFGMVRPSRGAIISHGAEIHPRPYEVVRKGIVLVPQGRRVFAHLSVRENLEIGGWTIDSARKREERIAELMDLFPPLKAKFRDRAGTLSGGQQQLLAIARGLMVSPHVLLLDEPTLGLSPKMVTEVFASIRQIKKLTGTTMVIVEHNIKSLLHLVNRAVILQRGRIIRDDRDVKSLSVGDYLGRVLLGS